MIELRGPAEDKVGRRPARSDARPQRGRQGGRPNRGQAGVFHRGQLATATAMASGGTTTELPFESGQGGTLPGHARPGGPREGGQGGTSTVEFSTNVPSGVGRIRAAVIVTTVARTAVRRGEQQTAARTGGPGQSILPVLVDAGDGRGAGSARQEKILHGGPPVSRTGARSAGSVEHRATTTTSAPNGSAHPSTYVARRETPHGERTSSTPRPNRQVKCLCRTISTETPNRPQWTVRNEVDPCWNVHGRPSTVPNVHAGKVCQLSPVTRRRRLRKTSAGRSMIVCVATHSSAPFPQRAACPSTWMT